MKTLWINIFIQFLVLNVVYQSYSQTYNIKVEIKGAANLDVKLAYYQGDNKYIKQVGKFDKRNECTFSGNEKLPTGIYLIIVGNIGYFDLLIRNEQDFSVTSDTLNFIKNIKIKGSKENILFYEYQNKLMDYQSKLTVCEASIKKTTNSNDSVEILKNEKAKLENEMNSFVEKTKTANPNSYLSKIIEATQLQDVDKFNFADEELLRTPFFHNFIRLFIKKNIEKSSSTIITETSGLLNSVKASKLNYEYIAGYLLNFYNTFYKIGINEVFVNIADNYFLPDKANWLTSKDLEQIKVRRDFLNQCLPGNKAQDLVLKSVSGEYISLLQLNQKCTLLYFWSTGCGHCTKATQFLKEKYQMLKDKGIEIYAVNIDKDEAEWKKKIEENELTWINCIDADGVSNYRDKYYVYGSPLLYLIDSNKKIIALKNGEIEIENAVSQLLNL